MSSNSASSRREARSNTHLATCSPFRLGRVLPRMMPIRVIAALLCTSGDLLRKATIPPCTASSSKYSQRVEIEHREAPVPLTAEEEMFLRALGRAMLTVPRALDADLLREQRMS